MGKRIVRYVTYLPPLALLALLLLFPRQAAEGARSGLSVCAGVILPSLFPFLVLSSLFSSLGLPAVLARLAGPLLQRLSLPPEGAAPRPIMPLARVTSASTVGLPRESMISRPVTFVMEKLFKADSSFPAVLIQKTGRPGQKWKRPGRPALSWWKRPSSGRYTIIRC